MVVAAVIRCGAVVAVVAVGVRSSLVTVEAQASNMPTLEATAVPLRSPASCSACHRRQALGDRPQSRSLADPACGDGESLSTG